MTVKVIEALDRIKNLPLFADDSLYFVGGTALAYVLEHRISEDIDIVCNKPLPYKKIIPMIESIGGSKLRDEKEAALRIAGLFPDEYMLKFDLNGVKLEFFQASIPIQKEILLNATTTFYTDAKLQMLDIKSIAKLKLVALLLRNKSRDMFDFKTILEKQILSEEEIFDLTYKTKQLSNIEELYSFIERKKEPKEDEAVYLDENQPIHLTFDGIKMDTLSCLIQAKEADLSIPASSLK